jgi:hypothetical protein
VVAVLFASRLSFVVFGDADPTFSRTGLYGCHGLAVLEHVASLISVLISVLI